MAVSEQRRSSLFGGGDADRLERVVKQLIVRDNLEKDLGTF